MADRFPIDTAVVDAARRVRHLARKLWLMLAPDQNAFQAGDRSMPVLATTSRELVRENAKASYYRARYYDPNVGRFIGEDPLNFGSGDTNFYRYVLNGPVILRDPTAKTCQCTYSISSGHFVCHGWGPHFVGPILIDTTGYSGYPPYTNNPFYDNVPNAGPIPIGSYSIGPGYFGSQGKPQFNLTPINPGNWFPSGRNPSPGSFMIHGDNSDKNNTGSTGCIVLPDVGPRLKLLQCDGGTLQVGP